MCRHAAFYWFVLDYMAAEMGDNVVTLQSEPPESPFTLGAEGGRLVGAWGCLGGPGVWVSWGCLGVLVLGCLWGVLGAAGGPGVPFCGGAEPPIPLPSTSHA